MLASRLILVGLLQLILVGLLQLILVGLLQLILVGLLQRILVGLLQPYPIRHVSKREPRPLGSRLWQLGLVLPHEYYYPSTTTLVLLP